MRQLIIFLSIASILLPQTIIADSLDSEIAQYSYSVGYRTGNMLRAQETGDLDFEAFLQGLKDSLHSNPLKLDHNQMRDAMKKHYDEMQALQTQKATDNKAKGKAYLEVHAKRKGVTTLKSGLQYEVIESGEGVSPQDDATVEVHYHGTLIDGTIFDSTQLRGKSRIFKLNRVLAGFKEALMLMKPGDKWKIVIPPELGYGEKGAGKKIGPNETLIFELELLKVLTKPADQQTKTK